MTVISFRFFFFKQKTAYEMRISDWSSDVCSSDLDEEQSHAVGAGLAVGLGREHDNVAKLPVRDEDFLAVDHELVAVAHRLRAHRLQIRSEERRVGQEGVSTCRSRWAPDH